MSPESGLQETHHPGFIFSSSAYKNPICSLTNIHSFTIAAVQPTFTPTGLQLSLGTVRSVFSATWGREQNVGVTIWDQDSASCWITPQLPCLWATQFSSLPSGFGRAAGSTRAAPLLNERVLSFLAWFPLNKRLHCSKEREMEKLLDQMITQRFLALVF